MDLSTRLCWETSTILCSCFGSKSLVSISHFIILSKPCCGLFVKASIDVREFTFHSGNMIQPIIFGCFNMGNKSYHNVVFRLLLAGWCLMCRQPCFGLKLINEVPKLTEILIVAFGAVDEPLASCMIVHFSAHISKWELVCKFGVIFYIFIISSFGSRFHAWFFLLYDNLFIYQVLLYTHFP